MEWTWLDDALPEAGERCLFWKSITHGGYAEGMYLGSYEKFQKNQIIYIHDGKEDKSNWRSIREFSHWMAVPQAPKL